jgi:hypothetical protein
MYSVRNDDLSIIDSRMEHCSADHAGGGLLLSGAHTGVVIENSTISFNSAREMGGASRLSPKQGIWSSLAVY